MVRIMVWVTQDHEFYGMSSMAYGGYRIGFLSVFHVLYESWVAQNPEGANNTGLDEESEWMNTMDVQLTFSVDGRSYLRAGNREPILKVATHTHTHTHTHTARHPPPSRLPLPSPPRLLFHRPS